MTIYGNVFHHILAKDGKFFALGGEDAGGTGEQKTPGTEELSQLVRELIAAVPWGCHANVLAKLTDPAVPPLLPPGHCPVRRKIAVRDMGAIEQPEF